jgi:hypothetical protein
MGDITIFAVFGVLLASFLISLASAWTKRSRLLQDFLFTGNTPLLALSSCIGSIVSMAVSFTALLSAGYVWGWQILFSIVPGSIAGLLMVLLLSRHPKVMEHQQRVERNTYLLGASYLSVLGEWRSSSGLYAFFIAAYWAMLITELVVLRTFITFLADLPSIEVTIMIGAVTLVCYAYVYIGGFRGVLVTDYFQLMAVFVFVGLWLSTTTYHVQIHVPSPMLSKQPLTAPSFLLLHLGVFAGAMAWTFASLDQWYRTIGTLRIGAARAVLKSAAIALCFFAAVPIITGASALQRATIPASVTNGVSLILVADLLSHSNVTLRFFFVMALTCAALTTLNTYFMTIQQLYYESSTRMETTHWMLYPFEWLLKLKEVRGFALGLGVGAFAVSYVFPHEYVYAFGVGALSTLILGIPFVSAYLLDAVYPGHALTALVIPRLNAALRTAVIAWGLLLMLVHRCLGSLTAHLYAIPATALGGAVVGLLVAVTLPVPRAWRRS